MAQPSAIYESSIGRPGLSTLLEALI